MKQELSVFIIYLNNSDGSRLFLSAAVGKVSHFSVVLLSVAFV